jgi:hypothetical protein
LFDRVVERNIDEDVFEVIKNDRKRSRVLITIDSRSSTKKKNCAKDSSRENLDLESNSKFELEFFFEKKKKKKKMKKKRKKKRKKKEKRRANDRFSSASSSDLDQKDLFARSSLQVEEVNSFFLNK